MLYLERRRQNRIPVSGILSIEMICARHGDNSHCRALPSQCLCGFHGHTDFRPRRNDNGYRRRIRLVQDVTPSGDVCHLAFATLLMRQRLTAEDQA